MQRFYVTFPLLIDLELDDEGIVHQLTRVMRIQVGERIILFDGDGFETVYEVTHISKKSLTLRGQNRCMPKTEPERNITLYQAFPNKREKIEYILQKWVEVGIRRFLFFRSDFSQKIPLLISKEARFTTIAREALEQCGGVLMPEIFFLEKENPILSQNVWKSSSWNEWGGDSSKGNFSVPKNSWEDFDVSEWQQHLVLDTLGQCQKLHAISKSHDMALWVWPEWGWSERERKKMGENGFIFVRLWERVLRTETAGIVTAFSLLHQ